MTLSPEWIEQQFYDEMRAALREAGWDQVRSYSEQSSGQLDRLLTLAMLRVWVRSGYADTLRHVFWWSSPLDKEGSTLLQAQVSFPPCARVGLTETIECFPTVSIPMSLFRAGCPVSVLFREAGLCATAGEARRLIQQGGARIDGIPVASPDIVLTADDIPGGGALLSAGKKRRVYIQLMYIEAEVAA